MKKSRFLDYYRRNSNTLLMILTTIAMIGFFVWVIHSKLLKKQDLNLPWNQQFLILKKGKEPEKPTKYQVALSIPLKIKAKITEQDQPRGKVEMLIHPNGTIDGEWTGEYSTEYPPVNFLVVSGTVRGNIVPSKVHKNNDREDHTKLYFITKGDLLILETNLENKKVRNFKGLIYITGWIETDRNLTAEIIITSNKRSYKTYAIKTKAFKANISDLF